MSSSMVTRRGKKSFDLIDETQNKIDEQNGINVDPKFEKVPYYLNADSFKLSSEQYNDKLDDFNEIYQRIEKIASQVLFRWSDVPVKFPDSVVSINMYLQESVSNELFILPEIEDELEECSLDSKGKTKKLNSEQLQSIRKNGSFEVQSINFPDKFHRWQLAKFLQKGSEKSNQTLYSGLSLSLKLIILTAKKRFTADIFSVLSGLKIWTQEFKNFVDILIGLPRHKNNDQANKLAYKLNLFNFLVSDLTVDESEKGKFNNLCNQVSTMLKIDKKRQHSNKFNKKDLIVPSFYRTHDNSLIDLRLFNSDLFDKIRPTLDSILKNNRDRKNKLIKKRQELINQLRGEKPNEEILKIINAELLDIYYNDVFDKILNNEYLESVAHGIGKTLCDHAKSMIIMNDEKQKMIIEAEVHINAFEDKLRKDHPIKSGVSEWFKQCVKDEKRNFLKLNRFVPHERAIEKLKNENLNQASYFCQRDLTFVKEKKDAFCDENNKKKLPAIEFTFSKMIWQPKNYIIEKISQDDGTNYYTCQKTIDYQSNTSKPFWRWKNFFLRTWCYTFNSIFIFGFLTPFISGISYKALFSIRPYNAYPEFNSKTGVMEINKNITTLTYFSRLSAIWKHVKISRDKFEATPDKGLIGKSMTRIFNVIWNYLFKGFIGSLGLTLVFPPLCLTLSTISLGFGLTAPLWYPIMSIIQHLLFAIVFDWELKGYSYLRNYFPLINIIFRYLIIGIINPVLALTTAIIICPVTSLLVSIFSLLRKSIRSFQDTFFYYLVLKPMARVPSHNTFVGIRISGPGLASSYLYQIKPEQALILLEMDIEMKILDSYMKYIRNKLDEPIRVYDNLMTTLFSPYLKVTSNKLDSYSYLRKEIDSYYNKYHDIYRSRSKYLLNHNLNRLNKMARLNEENLKIVMREGTKIVKKSYENLILKYMDKTSFELFNDSSLDNDDWERFTGNLLEDLFGNGILSPLEEAHEHFNLKVDHLDLSKYTEMIATSQLKDDLDDTFQIYNPKSDKLKIDVPEKKSGTVFEIINSQKFTLRSNKKSTESFFIPTLLPSDSVLFAILIHNIKAEDDYLIEYSDFDTLQYMINSYYYVSI